MDQRLAELLRLLELERLEINIFRGGSRDIGSPQVYGGQVLGQALKAAYATVDGDRDVHLLHAYFMRNVISNSPILYFLDRPRDGHSISSRRVTAVQHGEQIFNLSASFQVPESGLEHQLPMPEVPPPEGLPEALPLSAAQIERLSPRLRQFMNNRPIEFRTVSRALPGGQGGPPRQQLWMRAVDRLPDDEQLHRCLLAYASDFNLLGTALAAHERALAASKFLIASIDHTMWFSPLGAHRRLAPVRHRLPQRLGCARIHARKHLRARRAPGGEHSAGGPDPGTPTSRGPEEQAMNNEQTSRRGFLLRSAAVATSFAMAPALPGVTPAVPSPASGPSTAAGRLSAAAAGTLPIGDRQVNRLGFGAMRITGDGIWGEPRDHGEALAVLRRAIELGTNFIDTADAYGPYISEQLIREALHPYPPELIATKGGLVRPSASAWEPDGRPAHLREACEASLKRLNVEQIALYQFHRPDPKVPFEDSVGELAKLQREGKIRHIGLSNVDTRQLAAARALVRVVSVQNRYNVADRDSDDVLAICARDGIAFLPWAPLAGRDMAHGEADPRIEALSAIARERQIDMQQAALAWLLARSPVMLPIPGTSRVAHLEDNIASAGLRLTVEEMKRVG
jgi:acyl-CoA thioesterase II